MKQSAGAETSWRYARHGETASSSSPRTVLDCSQAHLTPAHSSLFQPRWLGISFSRCKALMVRD